MLVGSGRLPRSEKREDKGETVASTNQKGGGSAKAEHGGGVCAQQQVWRAGGGLWRSGRVRRRSVGAGTRAGCGASEHGDNGRLGGRRVGLPAKVGRVHLGSQAVDRLLKLVNASGGRIEHFGKGAVSFNPENCDGRKMEAKFEVTNVRKLLMAVARVVDAGKRGAVWSKARR